MIHLKSMRSLAFLQAEWIPVLTDCTQYAPSARWFEGVHKVSPNDWVVRAIMVILFRVRMCHTTKEAGFFVQKRFYGYE